MKNTTAFTNKKGITTKPMKKGELLIGFLVMLKLK